MLLKPPSQKDTTKTLENDLSLAVIQSKAVGYLPESLFRMCFSLPTEQWGSPTAFLTHLCICLPAAPLLQLELGVSEIPHVLQVLSLQGTRGHL